MPAYLVGTVQISDPARYAEYASAIKGLSAEYGGEPIVSGAVSEAMEGEVAAGERVVVTRFASAEQASAYLRCDRYVAARALRQGAASVQLRLVLG